jgi:23S rRNA-intervening sequence protein
MRARRCKWSFFYRQSAASLLPAVASVTLPHHSLIAWQRADDLFIALHQLSRRFPPIERFELASQLRRSAFSVAVNIVEGFGRECQEFRV